MYCTHCGTQHAQGAAVCANCGQPIRVFPAPPPIPNYLVQSVLVTLCCCLPLGVVAIVYSAQVNSKLAAGDIAGAQAASNSAKTWSLVAFVAGILTAGAWALVTMMSA